MDAISLSLVALGGLLAFGWLAVRAGVDSRDWPMSEEERLARFGLVWDDSSASGSEPLVDHARFRRLDLQREAAAERLLHLARQARTDHGRTGFSMRPTRSARAKLATALVTLAARVDRAAALDGAASQYLGHPPASCRAPASQQL
jgi:hypothetical protein